MEKRYCKTCGCLLSKNCKGEYCNHHRDRTGANNSFYGRKHSDKTKQILSEKCKDTTKKLWENEEYRNKVITNATGLKRSSEFKELQKKHAIEQFKDNKQKEIRSISMSNSWKNGSIVYNRQDSINESKQEKEFVNLVESLGYNVSHNPFLFNENGKKRHMFPDGVIENKKIIIEYNGSFWHADPKRGYKSTDVIHHGITAKEIWDRDLEKIKTYEKYGYKVFVLWSDEFLKNKEQCLEQFKKFINHDRNKREIL